MELKEFIKIIKNNIILFIGITLFAMLAVFVYFTLKPISYSTSLTLEITRSGSQETADYKFDDFYRLQADERFAETVVQWLKSPAVASEIYQNAGMDSVNMTLRNLARLFKSDKLSSQIVAVSFSSKTPDDANKISRSIFEILENNAEKLNKEQNQNNWFKIEAQNPIIKKNKNNSVLSLLASLLAGIFLAFWAVMIRHYLK